MKRLGVPRSSLGSTTGPAPRQPHPPQRSAESQPHLCIATGEPETVAMIVARDALAHGRRRRRPGPFCSPTDLPSIASVPAAPDLVSTTLQRRGGPRSRSGFSSAQAPSPAGERAPSVDMFPRLWARFVVAGQARGACRRAEAIKAEAPLECWARSARPRRAPGGRSRGRELGGRYCREEAMTSSTLNAPGPIVPSQAGGARTRRRRAVSAPSVVKSGLPSGVRRGPWNTGGRSPPVSRPYAPWPRSCGRSANACKRSSARSIHLGHNCDISQTSPLC